MARVDFVPDVDGFAFKNEWNFNEQEQQQVHDIVQGALPAAAALLTPIIMAVAPIIAPVAGLALGPVLPLIALAGPFLFAAAPKISELIVNAIADKIDSNHNLCGGMMSAALDYHRIGWVPPRGTDSASTPQFDPDNPDSIESWLRNRIWTGQIDNHVDDTPRLIMWKAVDVLFGDWGHDWLRDQSRDEMAKIDAGLSSGIAVPIVLLWNESHANGVDIGHVIVGYALDWYGPDHCTLRTYDNEYPDVETIYDIDLSVSPPRIIDRADNSRWADGIFLGTYRQKTPPPAIVLLNPLQITPPADYIVQGDTTSKAIFAIGNKGFSGLRDGIGGIRNARIVVAPEMSWQIPLRPEPNPPDPPPNPIPLVPNFSPIDAGGEKFTDLSTGGLAAGFYMLEPVIMAGSALGISRIPRTLPNSDGSPAPQVALLVNPRIPIKVRNARSGFDCARPLAEGDDVVLDADVSAVASRGIESITWTITGGVQEKGNGPSIAFTMPENFEPCDVKVVVALADGSEARGHATLTAISAADANRLESLCQLSHLVSTVLISNIHVNPLGDPIRGDAVKVRPVDANQLVTRLQGALAGFLRDKSG